MENRLTTASRAKTLEPPSDAGAAQPLSRGPKPVNHNVLPFPFEPEKTLIDGRFLVKGELGQGGMGRCYRVWQQSIERLCVLKMLAPKLHPRFVPERDARALLENEAKTLGLLAAGNDACVQVFDRGVLYILVQQNEEVFELDLPYYVMEFLSGYSLEALIEDHQKRQQTLTWDLVLSLCAQIAHALSIAHERGVIHRDLKPDNIFLHMRAGGHYIVKLIDFGVSTREGSESFFGTGTARYGAPEILGRSAARESTQSDMYPLGLVFYELAALRGPFVGYTKADYVRAHIAEAPPRMGALRPDCPPFFDEICARLLSKDPGARPSAKEVTEKLTAEIARRGSSRDAGKMLADVLGALNRQAVRRGAVSRAMTGMRADRSATTGSAESLIAESTKGSALYLTRAPSVLAAGTPTATEGDTVSEILLGFDSRTDLAPAISIDRGLPALKVTDTLILDGGGPPTIRDATAGGITTERSSPDVTLSPSVNNTLPYGPALLANVSRATGPIQDIADVPEFASMAQVFEAVWDDDDRYVPSPLDGTAHGSTLGVPSSLDATDQASSERTAKTSLSGLAVRSSSTDEPVAKATEPANEADSLPEPIRRSARVRNLAIAAAALGVLLNAGIGVTRWVAHAPQPTPTAATPPLVSAMPALATPSALPADVAPESAPLPPIPTANTTSLVAAADGPAAAHRAPVAGRVDPALGTDSPVPRASAATRSIAPHLPAKGAASTPPAPSASASAPQALFGAWLAESASGPPPPSPGARPQATSRAGSVDTGRSPIRADPPSGTSEFKSSFDPEPQRKY